jgi:predicted permease
METLFRDVRFALRRLGQAPGFTAFAVVSLALGIGVCTAIYSAVRTLLWMPLGVPDADALVVLSNGYPSLSWIDFHDLRAQQTSASAITAAAPIRTALRTREVSQTVLGEAVSGQYFTVMGLHPRLGRLIDPQDETSANRVAVLSEAFWRTRLNADRAIVGHAVTLGGQSFEVVGVIAGTFRGLQAALPESVWVPATALSIDPHAFSLPATFLADRHERAFQSWARLGPGAPVSRLDAEVTMIAQRLDAAYPEPRVRVVSGARVMRTWRAEFFEDQVRRATEGGRAIVIMILLAIVVVLLIACTNLANLALARGTARAQETAVRTALGASRWRLIREQVIEGAAVVIAGGGLSTLVLTRLVDYFSTDLPMGRGLAIPFRPEIDMSVLAASALAMAIALGVFGLWPAVQSSRADIRHGLGAGVAATPARWRFHSNLIAWQVCGSVALLLVAIMSVRVLTGGSTTAVWHPQYADLALAQIDFRLNGADESRARQETDAILAAARTQPGLQRVSATNGSPSSLFGIQIAVATPEQPFGAQNTITGMAAVTPDFLGTIGIGLARGRGFTDRDDAGAPRVAIVSQQLARDLFRTTDVLGRTVLVATRDERGLSAAPDGFTIVGISNDMTTFTSTRPDRLLFVPLAQRFDTREPIMIVARASDPSGAVGVLRSVVREVTPTIVVSAAGTGDVLLAGPLFLLRVIGLLAAALGALALVLAMAGLFGILTHVVERRRREIGIRLAIGAERSQILRLVLRDGLRPVGKGLVLGLAIGLGLRIVVRGQVFTTIAAWDPLEFLGLPLMFLIAALVASALPAARASRVDPNVVLRDL